MPTRNEFMASGLIALEPIPQGECPICSHNLTGAVALPCNTNHIFCRKCIRKWLTQIGNNTCPICRTGLFSITAEEKAQARYDRSIPANLSIAQPGTIEWISAVEHATVQSRLLIPPEDGPAAPFEYETFGLGTFSYTAIEDGMREATRYLHALRPQTADGFTRLLQPNGVEQIIVGKGRLKLKTLWPKYIAMAHLIPHLPGREPDREDWAFVVSEMAAMLRRLGVKKVRAVETFGNSMVWLCEFEDSGFGGRGLDRDLRMLMGFVEYVAWEGQRERREEREVRRASVATDPCLVFINCVSLSTPMRKSLRYEHQLLMARVSESGEYVPPDDSHPGYEKRKRPGQSPSRRTPHRNWYFNSADKIERQMQTSGYNLWGYVIYRTTYESDADWEEFLRRLRVRLERTLVRHNGRDIFELFELTVFDDRALFDGVDTRTIRAHFRQWSEAAALSERAPPGTVASPRVSRRPLPSRRPARYDFCIQVDEESLHSVVHLARAPPAPDGSNTGWVKLINKHWNPIEEDPNRRPGWEQLNVYEAVEGITERDVGWIKVGYTSANMEYYYEEEGMNHWRSDYIRPPEVAPLQPGRAALTTSAADGASLDSDFVLL